MDSQEFVASVPPNLLTPMSTPTLASGRVSFVADIGCYHQMLSTQLRHCHAPRPSLARTLTRSQAVASQPHEPSHAHKEQLVNRLLKAKQASGKSFTEIATEIGCTNLYTTALFYNQHQLKAGRTEELLIAAVPALKEDGLIEEMKKAPWRRFDPDVLQEPSLYRFYEFLCHNGEAIKALINEECGDGIMSAIDIYSSVDTVLGKAGEKRVVLRLNGKFLPFVEGLEENDTSR
jgi:cyanate lyase